MEAIIHLPKPHDKQYAFLRSNAKRRVIVAGRRGGKTTGASMLAVEYMLAGWRVLEAAPTADQTNAFWDACKVALRELIEIGVVYKNESERVLELPSVPLVEGHNPSPQRLKEYEEGVPIHPRIRTKTAHDADTLRGDYADLLILDEFSLMNVNAWDEVGAPMLLDNNGDAVFIFTPQRRNHGFKFYQRAIGDDSSRWGAWHFTSHDNPYLSVDALAEITEDQTEESYRQEILAEFLEGEGAVFRNIIACMGAHPSEYKYHNRHRLIVGVDWGKQADYTAISIGCADCRVEVAKDRFNKIDYVFQRKRLMALLDTWLNPAVLAERNSMGEPVVDQLSRDGVRVMAGTDGKLGFFTNSTNKPQLIENLALVLERTEWQFIPDPVWTGELEAYERKISPVTGRSQYSAPEGLHDDTVIARALMVWAAGRAQPLPEAQPAHKSRWMGEDDTNGGGSRWKRY